MMGPTGGRGGSKQTGQTVTGAGQNGSSRSLDEQDILIESITPMPPAPSILLPIPRAPLSPRRPLPSPKSNPPPPHPNTTHDDQPRQRSTSTLGAAVLGAGGTKAETEARSVAQARATAFIFFGKVV